MSQPSARPDAAPRFPSSRRVTQSSSSSSPSPRRAQPAAPHVPPIPPKSNLRSSASSVSLPQSIIVAPPRIDGGSVKQSVETSRTAPPAYETVPDPPAAYITDAESIDNGPVEGEKLAELRRRGDFHLRKTRGGWWRFALIALVIICILALILGLALGLTIGRRGKDNDDENEPSTPSPSDAASDDQPFPLGDFSMVTALRNITTNCTSNPSTWTCGPNQPSGSQTIFNWAIANTSSEYATIGTHISSAAEGIPANLSISSVSDIFTITFTNRSLTYISESDNSSARYEFDFTMDKAVFPTTAITSDNTAAQCFYNSTTFSGTLYLSQPKNYPESGDSNGTSSGGYAQWPYAVEIKQTSNGGDQTPDCYEYINGQTGNRITTGFTPEPTTSECLCDWNNF